MIPLKKKLMQIRKRNKNEVLSTVYMESKEVTSFDQDFLIVNLAHGVPVNKRNFNILKSYDFPVVSRRDKKTVTESDVRDYFKKHKKDSALIKYANFYCLLYFAKAIDISTAENFAQQIATEKIDAETIDSLLQTLIGGI